MGGPAVIGRVLRRLAVLLGVCAVSTLGVLVTPQAAAAPPQPQVQGDDDAAVRSYGGCLNGQRSGDLLLLIDESGSLRSSDPAGARIDAATYLLDQLGTSTERAGIRLDVRVAGFATEFTPATDWTTLDAASLPTLTASVEAFRDRSNGFDTDYWTALEGARRALGERASNDTEAGRCQAIAWFSDGKLDIEPRDTEDKQDRFGTSRPYVEGAQITSEAAALTAEQAATTSLCRGGGLADQIRSADVVTFAVGLAAGGASAADFELMRSIATGVPGGAGPCGDDIEPAPGSFTLASDFDDLLFAFDKILPSDITLDRGICAVTPDACTERHEFVLDDSINGVHILGSVDRPGISAQLIGPDGSARPMDVMTIGQTTRLNVGGVALEYSWLTPRSLEIDLDNSSRSASGWAGVWALVFVDPTSSAPTGMSRSSIRIWPDLVPAWLNNTDEPLNSGGPVPGIRLGLTRTDGIAIDPSTLRGQAILSAELVASDGTQSTIADELDKTELATPLTLDLTDVPPGQATLRLTLNLTTAPAAPPGGGPEMPGTALAPQQVDVPVTVAPPLGFPALAGRIDFGIVTFGGAGGTAELSAPLAITGPGCVWLDAGAPLRVGTVPDGVSSVAITADGATAGSSCVVVEEGQRGELILRLDLDGAGNGTLSGTVPVSIAPVGELTEARTVDVPFVADLRKTLATTTFLAALIAALILGPGIPLGLLFLVKWLTARIPEAGLSARRISITIDGGRVLRDGATFALRHDDFVHLVPIRAGGDRRLDVEGIVLRTRTGWSPFGVGHVSVEVPGGGMAGVSSTDPAPHGDHLRARLPLAVHNTWVVLHDAAGAPERAEVIVLVSSEATAEQRDILAADMASRLSDLLTRLRSAAAGRERTDPAPLVGAGVAPPGDPGPSTGYGQGYGPAQGYGPGPAQGYGPGQGYGPVGGQSYGQDYRSGAANGPGAGSSPGWTARFDPDPPSGSGPGAGPGYGPDQRPPERSPFDFS